MAITKKELYQILSNEEPDYPAIAKKLTKNNLVDLKELATGKDTMIATKAIYLASLVDDEDANDIVDKASKSTSELRKIAAASALQNMKKSVKFDSIASRLIGSKNAGIKKMALIAIDKKGTSSTALKNKIKRISQIEKSPRLKALSKKAISKSK